MSRNIKKNVICINGCLHRKKNETNLWIDDIEFLLFRYVSVYRWPRSFSVVNSFQHTVECVVYYMLRLLSKQTALHNTHTHTQIIVRLIYYLLSIILMYLEERNAKSGHIWSQTLSIRSNNRKQKTGEKQESK